jgi:hypothetical protein
MHGSHWAALHCVVGVVFVRVERYQPDDKTLSHWCWVHISSFVLCCGFL